MEKIDLTGRVYDKAAKKPPKQGNNKVDIIRRYPLKHESQMYITYFSVKGVMEDDRSIT
jgi:hypothetical protein